MNTHFFAWSNESESGFGAVVGSKKSINSSSLLSVTEDDGVGDDSDVSVDVDTKIELDDIAVLHDDVLLNGRERSVVANAVVDIGLGGEGNTLGHVLLFLVDFVGLLDDQIVSVFADLEGAHSDLGLLDKEGEDSEKREL